MVIPIVTIPLSLIGVCFVLFALGYSINLLTLLAMVLAIGLVVDDAIVVVENIHRHIEEGLTPVDAAIVGMREIFSPVISMTITLAAVYRANRLHAGPDRHAVPRVRVDARRRGRHLRHHRADLVADDVAQGCFNAGGRPVSLVSSTATSTRLENWYGRRLHGSLDCRGR